MGITWLIFFFFLRNFYFILFESGGRGATPGKRGCKIRVISRDGSGLGIDQVIARNLMREIEIFLPLTMLMTSSGIGWVTMLFGMGWALLFTLFPLFNHDRLRIGDLLAGTAVIHAPRRALLVDLSARSSPAMDGYRFTAQQLDAYGIAELQKLEEVLRGDNEEAPVDRRTDDRGQDRLDRRLERRATLSHCLLWRFADASGTRCAAGQATRQQGVSLGHRAEQSDRFRLQTMRKQLFRASSATPLAQCAFSPHLGTMRTISESVSVRLYHLDDGEGGAASTLFYGPLGEAMVIANTQPGDVRRSVSRDRE